jgi:hypothetical protein
LVLGWLALVGSIFACVFASGRAVSGAREDKAGVFRDSKEKTEHIFPRYPTSTYLNAAFYLLATGSLLIAGAAASGWLSDEADLSALALTARDTVASVMNVEESSLTVQSVMTGADSYKFSLTDTATRDSFSVELDVGTGELVAIRRGPVSAGSAPDSRFAGASDLSRV